MSLLPGSTGIPLSCVVQEEEQPQSLSQATDEENFVLMAKLTRKNFKTDSKEVHICMLPFLAKHSEAPSIVKGTGTDTGCRRTKWLALVRHCEGSGMHLNETVQAESTLQDLHHNGKNQLHMHWAKFKQLLDNACAALRKKQRRDTHPEEAKIQSSLRRTKDPDLKNIKAIIIQRAKDDSSCTFLQAMADLKEDVMRRHPVNSGNQNLGRVKEINAKKHQNCKHLNLND